MLRPQEAIMKRILLAGIWDGLALFVWGTLAHVVQRWNQRNSAGAGGAGRNENSHA
jgi:hypothetical protein